MRQYNFTLVLKPDIKLEGDEAFKALIQNLLGETKFTIKSLNLLGKKFLAYPIKKFAEGIYLEATLEATNLLSGEIQKRVNLNNQVLRFLLIAR